MKIGFLGILNGPDMEFLMVVIGGVTSMDFIKTGKNMQISITVLRIVLMAG